MPATATATISWPWTRGCGSRPASTSCSASGDQAHGVEVTFDGVVTVGRFQVTSSLAGLFVSDGSQSAFSGIFVRFPETQPWDFAPGRRVRITGKHYEYYCHTQFAATAMTDLGSAAVPAPRTIAKGLDAAAMESWEGVIVSIADVAVTGHNTFGDADTDAGLLIDDQILGGAYVVPPLGERFTALRGAIVWSFDRYRIAPRDDTDY